MATLFNVGLGIAAIGTFVSVVGLTYAARLMREHQRSVAFQLPDLDTEEIGLKQNADKHRKTQNKIAATLQSLAQPQHQDEIDSLRRRLVQAGFRGSRNLEFFGLARAGLAIVLPVFFFIIAPTERFITGLMTALMGATLGYYLPGLYIERQRRIRHEALLKPFPDALDLLVCGVEAGLGLDAALRRLSKEMDAAAPELAFELRLMNHQIAAGMRRQKALRRLAERNGVDEMTSLVNVLSQVERYGSSVAQALRSHAQLVRRKRMLTAEERAAKIAPKLTVAMIVFILPALFTILVGPTVVNVATKLLPTLTAGAQ